MHRKNLPFFLSLLLLILVLTSTESAYAKSHTVCQSGELGIGLLFTSGTETVKPTSNGIIYSHKCQVEDRSSASNWWEPGWRLDTQITNGPIDRGYAGPTEVRYLGNLYDTCYAAPANSACLSQDSEKPYMNYDIVPYCCKLKPEEAEDREKKGLEKGRGGNEEGEEQILGIDRRLGRENREPIDDDLSSYFGQVESEDW